jgi:SAM-dependent methyltransferase
MPEALDKPPEFDAYAQQYAELLRDPLRERFAGENRFFVERKLDVIRAFFHRRGIDTKRINWLDVGCGCGDLLQMGRQLFASAAGCDPSTEMLQRCATDGIDVQQQPRIDRIPAGDQSFDFVTAVCVYHHVPVETRLELTREILRVLRPNGIVSVIEHNPFNPVTRLIVSRTPVDANAKLLSGGQTRHLVVSASGKVLQTRYFLYLPEPVHRHFAWLENRLGKLAMGGQYAVFGTRTS